MFDSLTQRFTSIFSALSRKQHLTEANMAEAFSEIRRALLASDVAIAVVQKLIEDVKGACIGQSVLKNVQPGQQVVKIVYDQLVQVLGGAQAALSAQRPLSMLLVGLQGSGKTTTCAKLAHLLKKQGERPVLVAGDIARPAAIDQLQILGQSIDVPVLNYGTIPLQTIAQKALHDANAHSASVIIFDTAGRLQNDEALMDELKSLKAILQAQETLLVVDSALGQEAATIAKTFHDALTITGLVLTKLDGDAKCGAALSMKYTVDVPIKFAGVGEKIEDLEIFYPERIASRILGMGDVVSLVEKAQAELTPEKTRQLSEKLLKGDFNFEDMLSQLQHFKKMGVSRLAHLLPNMPLFKMGDEHTQMLKQNEALILSMTPQERRQPNLLLSPYRRSRILKGSGVNVAVFNKLMKQFQLLKKMSKKMRNRDPRQLKTMMDALGNGGSFLHKNPFQ